MADTVSYHTSYGAMIHGRTEDVLASDLGARLRGRVQLIVTSPPFPLRRQKQYGNEVGDAYVDWLAGFAARLTPLLTPTGSIVMEMGNAWEPGLPVMSTVALRALLEFLRRGDLYLCQQCICVNPTRLPSPAAWVTVRRSRLKDAYTHVWWMSPTPHPDADNRRVLTPYSPAMRRLLQRRQTNPGPPPSWHRPSGHHIRRDSFGVDHGGAIAPNVLTLPNAHAATPYLRYCRTHGLTPHPARMPPGLAEFFIQFLTGREALVLDPFAGSNTTGAAAEALQRRWLSIELNHEYVAGSKGRFSPEDLQGAPATTNLRVLDGTPPTAAAGHD